MPRYGVPGGKYLLAHLIFCIKTCFIPSGCDRQRQGASAQGRPLPLPAALRGHNHNTNKVEHMNEILVSESKTLKLTNVLSRRIMPEEFANINLIVAQMENFVRSHGAQPIGPLVQHFVVTKGPKPEPQMYLLRQANQLIAPITDKQYHMDAVLRVRNCLYAHYVGPMSRNELASQKLSIYAFEHDIQLASSAYTIFVSQDDEDAVIDVFMEKE